VNPFHILKPHFFKTSFILPLHLRLGLGISLLLSSFPTKIFYAYLVFLLRATLTAHPTLDLITFLMYGEQHKL